MAEHAAQCAGVPQPVLADTLSALRDFDLKMEFAAEAHDPTARWVTAADLASPEHDHLAAMLARYRASANTACEKVAASVLMLRFGWVGAFAIAPYLVCARVPLLQDYRLFFPPIPEPLPRRLWMRTAQFAGRPHDPLAGSSDWIESAAEDVLRLRLLQSLVAFTEPLVAALHAWSHRSRHGLWAMVAAIWGAQFQNVARALGDESRGVHEAQTVFRLIPEIAIAAPTFLEPRGGKDEYRQLWGSCCLYYKVTTRDFCGSCPIVPNAQRHKERRAAATEQLGSH
jgi:hypothetical protein